MQKIYTCAIADDNMIDRDVMEMYVSKINTLRIDAICEDGLEVINLLNNKEIDIVFSDIDMPHLSGLELLQSLAKPPIFIFVSSHAEHAAESYNLDVIDFIVKPVTLGRLLKATNKAIEYIELKNNLNNKIALPKELLPDVDDKNIESNDHFYIKENYDFTKILFNDLVYAESMGNFSQLYTVKNKKHIALVNLKNLELQLNKASFMRVHKQYIISLQHIVSISSNGDILLEGGYTVPLSSVYKSAFMDIIQQKMISRL